MKKDDVFGFGVEIVLDDPEAFLKIKETLQRIGIASYKNGKKTLFQSCHILHKRGRYFIVHFKEMFALDGRHSTFTKEDRIRRDIIAKKMDEWGLAYLVAFEKKRIVEEDKTPVRIKIISYADRDSWVLVEKYHIGV